MNLKISLTNGQRNEQDRERNSHWQYMYEITRNVCLLEMSSEIKPIVITPALLISSQCHSSLPEFLTVLVPFHPML